MTEEEPADGQAGESGSAASPDGSGRGTAPAWHQRIVLGRLARMDRPEIGRREFFGLLAWRAVGTAAGCILLGRLVPAATASGVAHDCDPSNPNTCTTGLNECTPAAGQNLCGGSRAGGTGNLCMPPGANSCRGTSGQNTCQGSSSAAVNYCQQTNGNCCVGDEGTNTCNSTSGGVANYCQPSSANVCVPESANKCIPASADAAGESGLEPPPSGD